MGSERSQRGQAASGSFHRNVDTYEQLGFKRARIGGRASHAHGECELEGTEQGIRTLASGHKGENGDKNGCSCLQGHLWVYVYELPCENSALSPRKFLMGHKVLHGHGECHGVSAFLKHALKGNHEGNCGLLVVALLSSCRGLSIFRQSI